MHQGKGNRNKRNKSHCRWSIVSGRELPIRDVGVVQGASASPIKVQAGKSCTVCHLLMHQSAKLLCTGDPNSNVRWQPLLACRSTCAIEMLEITKSVSMRESAKPKTDESPEPTASGSVVMASPSSSLCEKLDMMTAERHDRAGKQNVTGHTSLGVSESRPGWGRTL